MAQFAFRCTAFVGITLDGYIARRDGSIDYLPPAPASTDREHHVTGVPTITDMLANTDVLILGRRTYETVLQFGDGQWPYGSKPLILMTSQPTDRLKLRDEVTIATNLEMALKIIEQRLYHDVWVDGGATISGFIERRLVTELILTFVPIALGTGIPLFQGLKHDVRLELVDSEILGPLLATKYRVLYSE